VAVVLPVPLEEPICGDEELHWGTSAARLVGSFKLAEVNPGATLRALAR
jgi:hypothetical protein